MAERVIPDFGLVPAELKALPQWVNWRREEVGGKLTKVPYSPHNGRRASSTNSATWATFERVVEFLHAHSWVTGIGYVLSPDDGVFGVDLDHVLELTPLDPEPREIAEWAVPIITHLRSYTEVSPSGTGLRIFCRGALPPGGRKHGNFECYSEGRYLTVTGECLIGGPLEIAERTEQMAWIHRQVFGEPAPAPEIHVAAAPGYLDVDDHELIARAMDAANGEKFRALWYGNRTGYASDSESDLALCSGLLFWTRGDTIRADALFRQSGLYRDKWDERHAGDGRTYGWMTLGKALKGVATQPLIPGEPRRTAQHFGGVPL